MENEANWRRSKIMTTENNSETSQKYEKCNKCKECKYQCIIGFVKIYHEEAI